MKMLSPRKVVIAIMLLIFVNTSWGAVKEPPAEMSEETKQCVTCHKKMNPGITQQWGGQVSITALM